MQSKEILFKLIQKGRSDLPVETIDKWCFYLSQLPSCELHACSSPDRNLDQWLKDRTAGIGGSEIAAILGENPWKSPHQIWMDKVGMFSGEVQEQTEAARWGNLLETTVINEWALRTGSKWIHIPVVLRSVSAPWELANVDGFKLSDDELRLDGIVEAKTTSLYKLQEWKEGPVPFHYICQGTWYGGITQMPTITMVCLVGGQTLCWHELPVDPDLFAKEEAAAKSFWQGNVLLKIAPPLTEIDTKDVKKGFENDGVSDEVLVDDSDGFNNLAHAYKELGKKVTELKKVQDAIKAQLIASLKSHSQAVSKEYTITYMPRSRQNCNFDMLLELYPKAYAECVSTSSSRAINVR